MNTNMPYYLDEDYQIIRTSLLINLDNAVAKWYRVRTAWPEKDRSPTRPSPRPDSEKHEPKYVSVWWCFLDLPMRDRLIILNTLYRGTESWEDVQKYWSVPDCFVNVKERDRIRAFRKFQFLAETSEPRPLAKRFGEY